MRNENNNGDIGLNFTSGHKMYRSQINSILLLILVIIFSSCTKTNEDFLIIKEQGSFAVGGSVITNPGTFDAIERTPEGQTFHGDHALSLIHI